MKKTILLLCACLASWYAGAQNEAKFLQGESMTRVDKTSPGGKYVVGYSLESQPWGLDSQTGFKSFLWNVETGEQEWMTTLDEADYSKSGRFVDVTDDKVICGWFKDPDNTITVAEWGSTYTLPLNVAAVWKDGKVKALPFGDFDTTRFNNFNDGSFATAISADAKTVVGYMSAGNMAWMYPCKWTLDEATGEYECQMLALPEGCSASIVYDVSADGRVIVGYTRLRDTTTGMQNDYACIWTSADEYTIIKDDAVTVPSGCAYSVSSDGKYVAFTLDEREPALYFVDEGRYITLGRHADVSGLEIGGVTDNGDVFGAYKYGAYLSGDMSNRPFWYSRSNGMMMDFNYFTETWMPGVEMPYAFTYESKESVSLVSVSADGKVIAGGDNYNSFLITTDATDKVIPPTVANLKAKVEDLGQIMVTIGLPDAPEGFTMSKVVVYRDGEIVGEVAVGTEKTLTYLDKDVPAGERYYTAEIVYTDAEGATVKSPRHEIVSIQMESSFEFPFYENFDSGSLDTNNWTVVKDYGETDYQGIGAPMYVGLKSSCALNTSVMQFLPYSYSAVSRSIDARDKETVYASFAFRWEYVNSRDWPLDEDTISLEVCSDGETWEVAKDIYLYDMMNAWTFMYVDLTPWTAGKLFKIRFRFHGTGAAQYLVNVDELKIAEKPEREGMTDVLGGVDADGNFRLSWKNSLDAYPLTYLSDPYYNSYGLAIGDEGNTIIAANMFDKDDLGLFNGKYLTSVTATVNHDVNIEDTTDTHASIVIFEDGKLVREQEFTPVYNTDQVIKLDEPLQIDAAKELKIGVKVFDYDARQLPLPYYNTNDFVAGKSDLYSQDGGETWHKLSDLWAGTDTETDGYASWQITGNVTDSATPEIPEKLDLDRFAAEVYKNGEKLTKKFVYLLERGYADESTAKGDQYQVRVFYTDGTCTELSNTVTNDGTTVGIGSVEGVEDGAYTIEDGELTVDGGASKVEIYNAEGLKVYEGAGTGVSLDQLGHGMFIMKVYGADGATATHKLVF